MKPNLALWSQIEASDDHRIVGWMRSIRCHHGVMVKVLCPDCVCMYAAQKNKTLSHHSISDPTDPMVCDCCERELL